MNKTAQAASRGHPPPKEQPPNVIRRLTRFNDDNLRNATWAPLSRNFTPSYPESHDFRRLAGGSPEAYYSSQWDISSSNRNRGGAR
jgi:hypothetical protein